MTATVVLFSLPLPLFLVFLLKVVVDLAKTKPKQGPYPPGPKQLPLIGNALDLQMKEDLGADYMKWSKKYNSNILFATAFGRHVLIVNSLEDADELFERRAKIYSDRPQFPLINLIGWEGMVPLVPYGNYWRTCRRIMQHNFKQEAVTKYRPIILEKVTTMLAGLLESPDKLEYHNKMLTTSITMATMYGYQVTSMDDPMIAAADRNMAMGGSLLQPGPSLLNIFPFLGYIPPSLAGPFKSRKIAGETLRLSRYIQSSLRDFVEKAIDNGTAVPSLVTDFMEKSRTTEVSEVEANAVRDVALTTYNAASDTTISVTSTFFYLMAKYPEIQRKAQAEFDHHIGESTRLPEFDDRLSLPFIEAIYREVLRWQQSLHLAVPHALSEDDYYKGYFIPKGTIVLGNVWAMTHDERVYPDPYTFNPERFFDENGNLNNDSRVLAYGFGRRICAGRYIASSVVWFMMVSVLACFSVGKAKDEFGNEVELNDEYETTGFLTHKKEYKCSIVPRAPVYKELITTKRFSY